jgi:hypothetical protein
MRIAPALAAGCDASPGGGRTPGRTYHLLLRAVDESPRRNEDANTVVRTGTPY